MTRIKCGDANPKGNVSLIFKGGCTKSVSLRDSYRCTGCGGRFHGECILKHFEAEKDHDWGRKEERKKFEAALAIIEGQLYGINARNISLRWIGLRHTPTPAEISELNQLLGFIIAEIRTLKDTGELDVDAVHAIVFGKK